MVWDFGSLLRYVLTSAFNTTWDLITPENIAQAIGALAATLAITISLLHICRHWRYNRTKIRKATVRLLFIVPIFALDSWACLMLETSVYQWAEILTCFRELYEAVALVSFMELVLTILGGTQTLAAVLSEDSSEHEEGQALVHHVWPLSQVLPPYRAGPEFLKCMLLGIFQYVFVCLIYLAMMFFIWSLGQLELVNTATTPILRVVPNLMKAASCAWALNCLLLFAHEVYAHVPPCGLFLKFLSIKGIVFFTFWQGFVIWCCQQTGAFEKARHYISEKSVEHGLDDSWWSKAQLKSGLNDLLLCLEVLLFSVLHLFAYPAREVEILPSPWKERLQDDAPPGVERVLSAVNLMNISRLRDEVKRLGDGPLWWEGKFSHGRKRRHSGEVAFAADAVSPLIGKSSVCPQ